MFLLAFLALTVHKPVLEQLTNRNIPVKIFNCSMNIKTEDCAQSQPFQHKLARFHITSPSINYGDKEIYIMPSVVVVHYNFFCFSELIAWYGMAVSCRHLCVYLAWLTMVSYLAGRSHQTQLWYQKKIENFPKDRRNLFPGIY